MGGDAWVEGMEAVATVVCVTVNRRSQFHIFDSHDALLFDRVLRLYPTANLSVCPQV